MKKHHPSFHLNLWSRVILTSKILRETPKATIRNKKMDLKFNERVWRNWNQRWWSEIIINNWLNYGKVLINQLDQFRKFETSRELENYRHNKTRIRSYQYLLCRRCFKIIFAWNTWVNKLYKKFNLYLLKN